MLENLKTELTQIIKDIEDNLQDRKDKEYAKMRIEKMIDKVLETLDDVIEFEEERIKQVTEKLKHNEYMLDNLKRRVDNICQDIYDEEDESVTINCPYCGTEFEADIDEYIDEIKCPECENSIELDWNGNIDDYPDVDCGGSCSNCGGCNNS